MKRVLQFLGIVLAVILVVIGGLAGYIAYDLNAGEQASDFTNTQFSANGVELHAYLAQPSEAGKYPAVLMIHEWWGFRPDIQTKADALAQQGYVVLAVDAFRNRSMTGVPSALFNTITYPEAQLHADLDASLDYLIGLDNVDAQRVGVIGFCFGGRETVGVGVRNAEQVHAILTFYGSGQINTADGLSPLGEHDVAVLGVFGAEDDLIPMEEVDTFKASLNTLNLAHQVTVYDGVGHAFVQDLSEPGPSSEAWQEAIAFLGDHLLPEV